MAEARARARTLVRRLVTIPTYLALLLVWTAALPALLSIAILIDVLRRVPLVLTRTVLFFWYYLLCEVVGIGIAFILWVGMVAFRVGPETYRRQNYRLQWWWGSCLARGAFTIFSIRVDADSPKSPEEGRGLGSRPIIVFIRHVSVADTILPVLLLSARHRLRLRYVLKRELLTDPCLDLVGHRIPNYFVDRSALNTDREIRGVAALMDNLGPGEGVLLYPEGTRFTPAKRERVIERFERRGDAIGAARTRALRSVLPPRAGGALALLERAAGCDVVFCAHTGFEGATSFWDLWKGGLVGAHVRVAFWTAPGEAVPQGRDERLEFLHDMWSRVDRWVGDGGRGDAPEQKAGLSAA